MSASLVGPGARRLAVGRPALPAAVLGLASVMLLGGLVASFLVPGHSVEFAHGEQAASTLAAILALSLIARGPACDRRRVARGLTAAMVATVAGVILWDLQPALETDPSPFTIGLFLVGTVAAIWTLVPPVFVAGLRRRQVVALAIDALILLVAATTFGAALWRLVLAPAGWSSDMRSVLVVGVVLVAGAGALFLGLLHRRVAPGLRGAYAVIDGITVMGIALIAWLTLVTHGNPAAAVEVEFLYGVGVLLVAYGAATWDLSASSAPSFLRFARFAIGAFPPAAVFICLVLNLVAPKLGGLDVVNVGSAVVVALALLRQIWLTVDAHRANDAERAARISEGAAHARLAREIEDRAAVLASLLRLEAKPTSEETAREICRGAVELEGIDGAVIRAFDPSGQMIVLGASGPADLPGTTGMRLSRVRSAIMAERVTEGPWVETFGPSRDEHIDHLFELGLRATANAPLVYNDQPIGVVGLSSTSETPGDALAERLTTAREFGLHAGALLGPGLAEAAHRAELRASVSNIIATSAFQPVFQPVVDIQSGATVGFEALTRFTDGRRPDLWFADADACGMGPRLELACLRAALVAADALPADAWLSVNASPGLAGSPSGLIAALETASRSIVLEITEHAAVGSYEDLKAALAPIRPRVRIAVDDAGAGYSGLQQILEIEPDIVKLDITLVRSVDSNLARRALVSSMVSFAAATGCTLLAEGIETVPELDTLRALGVTLGQGYLIARPAPVEVFATDRPALDPACGATSR